MADIAAIDVQTPKSHLDEDTDLLNYTYDKLLEYWSMVYTLGLISGVVGTKAEQEKARQAIMDAVSDAAETAVSYIQAAAIAADDYTVPGLGLIGNGVDYVGLLGIRTVQGLFGTNTSATDAALADLELRTREEIAVDLNQVARASKAAKVLINTTLDTDISTDGEAAVIQNTQAIVDKRRKVVTDALNKAWNSLKDVALARYNQFMDDMAKGGVGYALGTLAIDGHFMALEIMIGIAAGIVSGGVGAVALKVSVTIAKKLGGAGRVVRLSVRNSNSTGGKSGILELDEKPVNDFAKENSGLGDDLGGMPGSAKDPSPDAGGKDVDETGKDGKGPDRRGDFQEMSDAERQKIGAPDSVTGRYANDPPGVYRYADGRPAMVHPDKGTWTVPEGLSSHKGSFGEMMGNNDLALQGHTPVVGGKTQLGDATNTPGIDGIWNNADEPPPFLVVEQKYRSGDPFHIDDFPTPKSGVQMGPKWLAEHFKDLGERGVLDLSKVDALKRGQYTPVLQRIGPDGKVQNIDLKTGKDMDTGEQVFEPQDIERWRNR